MVWEQNLQKNFKRTEESINASNKAIEFQKDTETSQSVP